MKRTAYRLVARRWGEDEVRFQCDVREGVPTTSADAADRLAGELARLYDPARVGFVPVAWPVLEKDGAAGWRGTGEDWKEHFLAAWLRMGGLAPRWEEKAADEAEPAA